MKTLKINTEEEARALFAFFNYNVKNLYDRNPIDNYFYVASGEIAFGISYSYFYNDFYKKTSKTIYTSSEYYKFIPFDLNINEDLTKSISVRLFNDRCRRILNARLISDLYNIIHGLDYQPNRQIIDFNQIDLSKFYVVYYRNGYGGLLSYIDYRVGFKVVKVHGYTKANTFKCAYSFSFEDEIKNILNDGHSIFEFNKLSQAVLWLEENDKNL
jgi:hypothetical protein